MRLALRFSVAMRRGLVLLFSVAELEYALVQRVRIGPLDARCLDRQHQKTKHASLTAQTKRSSHPKHKHANTHHKQAAQANHTSQCRHKTKHSSTTHLVQFCVIRCPWADTRQSTAAKHKRGSVLCLPLLVMVVRCSWWWRGGGRHHSHHHSEHQQTVLRPPPPPPPR